MLFELVLQKLRRSLLHALVELPHALILALALYRWPLLTSIPATIGLPILLTTIVGGGVWSKIDHRVRYNEEAKCQKNGSPLGDDATAFK